MTLGVKILIFLGIVAVVWGKDIFNFIKKQNFQLPDLSDEKEKTVEKNSSTNFNRALVLTKNLPEGSPERETLEDDILPVLLKEVLKDD